MKLWKSARDKIVKKNNRALAKKTRNPKEYRKLAKKIDEGLYICRT